MIHNVVRKWMFEDVWILYLEPFHCSYGAGQPCARSCDIHSRDFCECEYMYHRLASTHHNVISIMMHDFSYTLRCQTTHEMFKMLKLLANDNRLQECVVTKIKQNKCYRRWNILAGLYSTLNEHNKRHNVTGIMLLGLNTNSLVKLSLELFHCNRIRHNSHYSVRKGACHCFEVVRCLWSV